MVLWILGQYCETREQILQVLDAIKASVGDLPLYKPPSDDDGPQETSKKPTVGTGPTILADGTYQTQSAVLSRPTEDGSTSIRYHLPFPLVKCVYRCPFFSCFQPYWAFCFSLSLSLSLVDFRKLLFAGDYYLATSVANCLTKITLTAHKLK
jgi:hypothetical protein